MNFIIKQENLLSGLKKVGRLSSGRTSLAILSNTLLKAVDGSITLTTTNLEAAITYKTVGKIINDGSVAVPTKLLLDLVGNMPNSTIEVSLEGNKTTLKSNGIKSTINSFNADEFPVIPQLKNKDKIRISALEFKKGLSKVVPFSSKDDTRPILNSVYLKSSGGSLTFAATDSYRLAEYISNINTDEDFEVVLPNQSSQELTSLLDGETDLFLTIDNNQIQFDTTNSSLMSKTIDGNYPDYKNLIPKSGDVSAEITKSNLVGATKTAGLFAKDIGGSIKFEATEDGLDVQSTATQLGENNSLVTGQITGRGDVSFNSRYMVEALSNIDGEAVLINYSSNISPITIRGVSEESLTQLIMPLKT